MAMLLTTLLGLVLLTAAHAGDLEAGLKALQRGDYTRALRELLPLAEQGNIVAQYNLGVMYFDGKGVPKDDTKAVKWYRLAAKQGDAEAQNNLGVMYANGEGVPKDDAQAYAWLNAAAEQGDDTAEDNKKLIAERMTPEEHFQAQELARQYWEAYVQPFRQ